jgi:hypothetical protein
LMLRRTTLPPDGSMLAMPLISAFLGYLIGTVLKRH